MLDFQVPRITSESVDDNRGTFTIEPLDRGFGYTFGNSLRRVLLSSLSGAAVTSVRIEGVAHEFSTIKGVKEDVTDIVLNLKGIVCRMHSDATEVEAPLVVTGPGDITAKDIDLPAGVEILNPDVHVATLENKAKLEMYMTIGHGRRADGRHPHRGARARRALVQLPQARGHPDGRRPGVQVRGRAQRDPELRQEVDRRGHRDPARARAQPARGLTTHAPSEAAR